MSKVNELLTSIKSQLGEDNATTINPLLKEIEAEYNDVLDSLKAANTESKNRKLKLRELESEKEEWETKLSELQDKADTSHLESELQELREYKQTVFKNNRDSFINRFAEISKHPNFEIAKSKFNVPEKKGEKLDWESLEEDKMAANIKQLKELDDLKYFSAQNTFRPNGNKFTDVTPQEKSPVYKSKHDIKSNLVEKINDIQRS